MLPQTVGKQDTLFTWTDYRTWPDDERWELIAGVAYTMAPAPSTKHQSIGARLYSRPERGLEGKSCKPFIAPTDVKLSDLDVVQPDILVVCDSARITPTHIEGALEVVIEVLPPPLPPKIRGRRKHSTNGPGYASIW